MKVKKRIPISGPSITKREVDFVARAAKNGWYDNSDKYIREFENKFAKYIGVKYALATDSCTGAMHLALLALGIGAGEEVIVPDITWISTAAVVKYVGATPVFADIEKDTWCIDPLDIRRKITNKTKAIMPVHLYGQPADMDKVMFVAKKNNLFVVEDAAESVGSLYKNKQTGSFGDFGCFSFFGAKIMVTGEGGMLVTNNKRLFERAVFLNSQGSDPKKKFWQTEVGCKYRMSNLQAALGIAQLSRIEDIIDKKRKIFQWYKEELRNINSFQINTERPDSRNNYWMVTVVVDKKFKIKKTPLMKKLLKYNIESRPFFYPLSSMPPFKTTVENPVSYSLSDYAVNLPCALNLTRSKVKYICNIIKEIIKE